MTGCDNITEVILQLKLLNGGSSLQSAIIPAKENNSVYTLTTNNQLGHLVVDVSLVNNARLISSKSSGFLQITTQELPTSHKITSDPLSTPTYISNLRKATTGVLTSDALDYVTTPPGGDSNTMIKSTHSLSTEKTNGGSEIITSSEPSVGKSGEDSESQSKEEFITSKFQDLTSVVVTSLVNNVMHTTESRVTSNTQVTNKNSVLITDDVTHLTRTGSLSNNTTHMPHTRKYASAVTDVNTVQSMNDITHTTKQVQTVGDTTSTLNNREITNVTIVSHLLNSDVTRPIDHDVTRLVDSDVTQSDVTRLIDSGVTHSDVTRLVDSNVAHSEVTRLVDSGVTHSDVTRLVDSNVTHSDVTRLVDSDVTHSDVTRLIDSDVTHSDVTRLVDSDVTHSDVTRLVDSNFTHSDVTRLVDSDVTHSDVTRLIDSDVTHSDVTRLVDSNVTHSDVTRLIDSDVSLLISTNSFDNDTHQMDNNDATPGIDSGVTHSVNTGVTHLDNTLEHISDKAYITPDDMRTPSTTAINITSSVLNEVITPQSEDDVFSNTDIKKTPGNRFSSFQINPLTAGAEYIRFFTKLLPHSALPFKHVKAMM